MTTVASVAIPVSSDRSDFVFSGSGRYGVCLRSCDAQLSLERWTLRSEMADVQTIPDVAVDRHTDALPLDDGRVLLSTAARSSPHHRELALLQPANDGFVLRGLATIPAPRGGYLLSSPNPYQLGFVVTVDDRGHSTIWRLPASPGPAEPMMQVPGYLTGGVWLDGEALVLGANQTFDGSPCCTGIAVDLRQRSWTRIWSASDTSSDQILLFSPHSKLIIVSTTISGPQRLGWALLGDPTVRFPETLHRPGYVREALALDDRGKRLLVHEVAGATSRLFVYTPADDHLEALTGPPGTISTPASWVGDLIRFRWSAPHHPPTLGTVRVAPQPRWSSSQDHELDNPSGNPEAELIQLKGPAGPIEAIVYGGSNWRQCDHIVMALHGGPLSCWHFRFEPLFQRLSAEGIAVVAPNYRGSTGYGDEHLRAVIGDWGGPDLQDVLDLGRNLEKDRASRQLPRPVVLGMSYGAFLALLAACHEPQLWSACVAVAPFLSGPRFHQNANAAVRRRIEQLGGLRHVEDALGPRDVLQTCASMSAPLLIMHGARDETIPVEQSRTLRQRLLELGRTEDVDFEYAEVDSDHAALVLGQDPECNQRVVRFCLRRWGQDSKAAASQLPEPLPTVMGSGKSHHPMEGHDSHGQF